MIKEETEAFTKTVGVKKVYYKGEQKNIYSQYLYSHGREYQNLSELQEGNVEARYLVGVNSKEYKYDKDKRYL